MRVSNGWFLILFAAASVVDFATTLYGIRAGFSEANPLIAAKLANLPAFILTYLAYTIIGLALLWLVLRMSFLSRAFRAFAALFVALKALPALNNIIFLTGLSPLKFILLTTARWLLGFS